MKNYKASAYILALISLFTACKKDNSENEQRPVIHSIDLNLEQVTPGATIKVTSSVTDPEGDNLTYTWTSTDGTLTAPGSSSTDWVISPVSQSNSIAKIVLTVSDGKTYSTAYKEIPVVMGINVSGKVIFSGTSIPVPGVELKMGPFTAVSASDGRFFFFHIAPGDNTLAAMKTGFDTVKISENLLADKGYLIPMTSSVLTKKVYGTVKTIDSIPLPGIRVLMLNDDKTESTLSALTDNNGYYEINAVPLGSRNFKLIDESNPNNCETATSSVSVNNSDTRMNVRMKIERLIDMLQNGWEFKSSDLSAPWNGTSYVLTTNGTNPSITNKCFRPAFCCPIPGDADNPQVILTQRLTGTLSWPGILYYKSPASTQFYMTTDCNTWPDYSVTIYTYWTTAITSFTPDYISINSSYKGESLKLTFGLLRWSGSIPLWEIKSIFVSYYY